jgi:uncharacterized protein (DUF362 family)
MEQLPGTFFAPKKEPNYNNGEGFRPGRLCITLRSPPAEGAGFSGQLSNFPQRGDNMAQKTARVALIKGDDRYTNASQALQAIAGDIDLTGKRHVIIKPNLVHSKKQVASTHPDAIRATLDFVRARYDGKISIAEASEVGATRDAWENFGYIDLAKKYEVELLDIYGDEEVSVPAFDRTLSRISVKVSRTVAEADFRISVCPPKTHDCCMVTLSAKNMVVGCLNKTAGYNDRKRFHQGYPAMNLNVYSIVQAVYPHLSLLDGFVAMEGAGPVSGEAVDLQVAVASADFVAADAVGASVMGQDLADLGWLTYFHQGGLGCGNLEQIEVLGATIEECRKVFRRHPDYALQAGWRIPGGAAKYLEAATPVAR